MSFVDLLHNFMPGSYSQLDQIRAATIITTSIAISLSMLLLVLYWLMTKSFETKATLLTVLAIMVILAICIGLVALEQIAAGAWVLISLMVLLNFLNLKWYGISTPSAAAYVIPILLAIFCIGAAAGFGITILGIVFVFTIPILQSKGIIKTVQTYTISNLTFDAPVLALIYILITIIGSSWESGILNSLLHS
jgi:hypothetical protein